MWNADFIFSLIINNSNMHINYYIYKVFLCWCIWFINEHWCKIKLSNWCCEIFCVLGLGLKLEFLIKVQKHIKFSFSVFIISYICIIIILIIHIIIISFVSQKLHVGRQASVSDDGGSRLLSSGFRAQISGFHFTPTPLPTSRQRRVSRSSYCIYTRMV